MQTELADKRIYNRATIIVDIRTMVQTEPSLKYNVYLPEYA